MNPSTPHQALALRSLVVLPDALVEGVLAVVLPWLVVRASLGTTWLGVLSALLVGVGFFVTRRAGVSWLESSGRGLVAGAPVDLRAERKASDFLCAGLGYDFNPNFGVSLRLDRYALKGRTDANPKLASVAAEYRF